MTQYADPGRCPDCRGPITAGLPACPSCGLPLSGVVAQRLYQTLLTADRLLVELRAGSVAPSAAAGGAPVVGAGTGARPASATSTSAPAASVPGGPTGPAPAPGGPWAPGPAAPTTPGAPAALPARPGRGLGAASVPKILLALGAGCVLVAALVFLAVAWSVLGVGGRTATLVALTLGCGALAWFLARRDLRGGAEALAVVTWGLLTLDLFGARDAGWLGGIGDATYLLVLGVTLAGTGAAAAVAARRTPVRRLVAAELVAVLGVAAGSVGVAAQPGLGVSAGLLLATLLAAAATVGAHLLRLSWTERGAAVVALGAWLSLVGTGWVRALDEPSFAGVWRQLDVWPLLAATALAGGVAAVPALSRALRAGAAAAALGVAALAVSVPVADEGPTAVLLAGLAVLVAGVAVAWRAPVRWRPASLVVLVGAGLLVAGLLLSMVAAAVATLVAAALPVWAGSPGERLTMLATDLDLPAGLLLPVTVAVLVGAVVAVVRAVGALGEGGERAHAGAAPRAEGTGETAPVTTTRGTAARPVAGLVAAASVLGLGLYAVPVGAVVAVGAVLGLVFVAWWWRETTWRTLAWAAALLTGTVAVSLAAAGLTAAALLTVVLAAGVVHLRARGTATAAGAGAVLLGAVAGAGWTLAHLAGLEPTWGGLLTLVVLAAVVLPAHALPARLWSCPDARTARTGLEVGAAVAALPLATAGVLLAPAADAATWAAVYLTVAGAAVTALGLLRPDRRRLLPAGGLLLVAASWVRLQDLGVEAVEPYTLPAAAVLGAVGLHRLLRHRDLSSLQALSPALALGLVPSLLWALVEPDGLRRLLLGLACLALVLAGARLQWAAPLVWGAGVGAVLLVRLAAPYVGDAVPRWVLIGAAGAALIVLGVTYERRLQEARRVVHHLQELR